MVGKFNAGRLVTHSAIVIIVSLLMQSVIPPSIGFADSPEPTVPEAVVLDIMPGTGSSAPGKITAIGSTIFFRADDDDSGQELWKMNPPYIEPVLVADINPGDGGSLPENLTPHGELLFFTANDGKTGVELWMTEPPYNSAHRVNDINAGRGGSYPLDLTPLGNAIFFFADDGSTGRELWMAQSPYRSAVQVADVVVGSLSSEPEKLTRIGWYLFFSAKDWRGRELFMAGPPYAGVQRVTDIYPGGSANPEELTPLGTTLFFTASSEKYGREMWKTVPPYTPLSTTPLNDFTTRKSNTNPYGLMTIGDTIFFSANIGMIGVEPWKSVPPYTMTNTTRVADVNEGLFQSSFPENMTAVNTTLFFTAFTPKFGLELWRSEAPYNDDTTERVTDINSGAGGSFPGELTPVYSTLYFTAIDEVYGRQLWKLERPYSGESQRVTQTDERKFTNPENLFANDGLLFLIGTDPRFGMELWRVGGYGLPATGFRPGVVTRLKDQPADKGYQASDMRLEIPRLGTSSSIVGVPAAGGGWDLTWLGDQAGYLEGTAFPTWAGNTAITAHVTGPDGLPGPFSRLHTLVWGDQVLIRAWGQRYLYEVRSIERTTPNDLSIFSHQDLDWLTLITCVDFDEASGEYKSRLVVKAVLIRVEAE
jgi:LPXTG-site transpeptidase (sortase) family protein